MKKLHTTRLIIRPFTTEDIYDFYEYAKQENVGIHAGWPAHDNIEISKEILQTFIDGEEAFAIEYIENKKVIGSIGLHIQKERAVDCRNLGYVLHPNYWGKGLATEATLAMLQYAFNEMHLEMVIANHFPYNIQSKRVLEKCGFIYEGCLRKKYKLFNGQIFDAYSYSITKEEWENYNI
ncbi:MAG: GNAT family N-acetyltransferase [Coprobacillaceae bacterium]